ncbi:MAG: cytidine deaminase [Eubacteriaceae bacterium]|nr:cytidine deaminase [Eubacteriaceae bacterium]
MINENIKDLIDKAIKARKNAYAPYSKYKVGAALLTASGKIYTGCNIENSAYSPTVCAERTAFFKAVSEGEKDFLKMALVCGYDDNIKLCTPCGVCLQVMAEFCKEDFEIITAVNYDEYKIYKFKDLLPYAFNLK